MYKGNMKGRMAAAKTAVEINELLKELDGYSKASPVTVARIKRIAAKKLESLNTK